MAKESKRTQLVFDDDGTFEFRKLPLLDACLIEKANNVPLKAWKHFFSAQIPFYGFTSKGGSKVPLIGDHAIQADLVTLSYDRDIILDPFNKVPEGEEAENKPQRGDIKSIGRWVSQIAKAQRYKVQTKPPTMWQTNVIIWVIGGIDVLLALGWLVSFMLRMYAK